MRVEPLGYSTEVVRTELDRLRHPFRIALLRAKNAFNIGAVIRTAHSFLAREIILVGDEPYYKRAAMGMAKYEHIVELPTEEAFLERAASEHWHLVGFEKDHATVGLWDATWPSDCVLLFGNEDAGLSANVLNACAAVVGIPMYGVNHSYPVTVAAGIAMAEWARRHHQRT